MTYSRRQIIRIFVGGALLYTITPLNTIRGKSRHNQTVSALTFLHDIEATAHQAYLAYADKADSEKYRGIANLFRSLAMAEQIHATRLRAFLSDLTAGQRPDISKFKVRGTKENLKNAIETELYHIETVYPSRLDDLETEGHDDIISFVYHAWQSEMIHRDLLKKIKSAMGMFFNVVARRIEEKARRFYVCPSCGSLYDNMDEASCRTCGNTADTYIRLVDGQLIS